MTGETISILCLIGSGIYAAGASTFRFFRDKRALNWPTSVGEVVTSRTTGKWDSSSNSSGGSEFSYMYAPEVIYSYIVDGRRYEGNRAFQFEVSSSSSSWAEKSASNFPVGMEVEVFYNPRKPSRSMIRQAALKLPWYILGLILGASLITGGVVWHLKRDATAVNKEITSTLDLW